MSGNDWNDIGNRIKNIVQDAVESQNYQELNRQVKGILNDAVGGFREGIKGDGAQNGTGENVREDGRYGREDSGRTENQDSLRESMKSVGAGLRDGLKSVGEDWKSAWKASKETDGDGAPSYRDRYRKVKEPGYRPGQNSAAGGPRTGKRRMGGNGSQHPELYARYPRDQVMGTVMAIAGFSLTGVFALSTLSTVLLLVVEPGLDVLAMVGTVILGSITAASLALGLWGQRARGRAKRFREYVAQIGQRGYCTVKELAQKCGYKEKKVRRDLKRMIESRMFLQGHMDEEETCIIATDSLYQQYLTTKDEVRKRQVQQEEEERQKQQLPEECRKVLEEGREYILHIRRCNDELPEPEISNKLYRLETIITRIFDEVEKDPELAGELRKFMSYYLPTTKKLVDAYVELEREPVAGENVVKMKKEIQETLDTINQAFENLLDGFFEEKAWDISSDISVLHTMFAQEGLTGGDFDRETADRNRQTASRKGAEI